MVRELTAAAGILLAAHAAGAQALRLRWSELAPVVENRNIRAMLGGVRIEGKTLGIEPDALRVDITKTGDRRAWPKGEARIPRPRLTAFEVVRSRTRWRPILGIGMPVAIAIATWQAAERVLEGGAIYIVGGIGGAAVVGTAVAGYLIGRRLDRYTVAVTVIPE